MESISRSQLVEELRVYEAQCADNVEFFAINEGWHGAAKLSAHREELGAVRAFLAQLEAQTTQAPAAPQKAAQGAVTAPRCEFYKSIKRAFAVAREAGLDTRADEAMRAAFSRVLGKRIETRKVMTCADWLLISDAIKAQKLTW